MFLKERKIIFFHIPKTAGDSVEDILSNPDKKVPCRHYTLSKITELANLNLKDYIIFTIYRHPLERIVSTFNHMKRIKFVLKMSFDEYLNNIDLFFLNKLKRVNNGFYLSNNNKVVVDERHIQRLDYWINVSDGISLKELNLSLQDNIFTLSNKKVCIYLLRFNHLKEDWGSFKKNINVNTDLPKININPITKSKRDTYLHYYQDDEQKRRLLSHYKEEIDLLKDLDPGFGIIS